MIRNFVLKFEFLCYNVKREEIMQIFLNILYLVIGLALLIFGADFFVSGASSLAKKLKIPTMIIGLTIVAIGTSLPELVVSIISTIKGNADISIGNVIGSNMANMLLIVGVVACIKPIDVKKTTRHFDLPFMALMTLLLLIFSADSVLDGRENVLARSECIVFILLLIYYMLKQIINVKRQQKAPYMQSPEENGVEFSAEQPKDEIKILPGWRIALYTIFGLAGVVGGGELVSMSSKFLALAAGMSDALVGLTIVALGTSLPELVTSIVAVRKGEHELALGNVLGSNIMNIILILGVVGTISSIAISAVVLTDLLILTCMTIIFLVMCYSKKRFSRIEGVLSLLLYVSYIAFAIVRNYAF